MPVTSSELLRGVDAAEKQVSPEAALVAPARAEQAPRMDLRPAVAALSVELDVSIPVRGFRVRNLLVLDLGTLIETQWSSGEDMPLRAGDVQLAWSEFDVLETQLAVRVTRLA